MTVTPLEAWTRGKLEAWARGKTGALRAWQLERLRETLQLARRSPFYSGRLPAGLPRRLEDLQELPFMDGGDLRREGMRLLCAPQSDISRIVTLRTSGTSPAPSPKRVCFTAGDQELTVDYFAAGLSTVAAPGNAVLVMLPCGSPGGVGDLICQGLSRIPARPVPSGPLASFREAKTALLESGAASLIGLPSQALAFARHLALSGGKPASLKTALLTADYVPRAAIAELNRHGIDSYSHYGMTEMGLGCAIDCSAHCGMHVRETDLLLEVTDPATGAQMPGGAWGEIVFTTLTRAGMPFVRYRTGDISRILPGRCPCGGSLLRIDTVRGRLGAGAPSGCSGGVGGSGIGDIGGNGGVAMPDLDEAVFALPQVMDFSAAYNCNRGELRLDIATFAGMPALREAAVRVALAQIPALGGPKPLRAEINITQSTEYARLYKSKRIIHSL